MVGIGKLARISALVALLASVGTFGQAPAVLEALDTADSWLENWGYEIDREQLSRFADPGTWEPFLDEAERLLREGTIESLAALRPDVEAALAWLRQVPELKPYVGPLEQIADYFRVADEAVSATVPDWPKNRPRTRPFERPPTPPRELTPPQRQQAMARARSLDTWRRRAANRPLSPQATQLAPLLKDIFRREGIPQPLIWVAEVESSFDPKAVSPAGAVGLFQLMPATAQRFGLRVEPPDERLEVQKNARVAARYLRFLHRRFGNWPLALAGYNAGEGRVTRALQSAPNGRGSFEEIADRLPLETQMYVPKVAAVVERRANVALADLPPPRSETSH